MAKRASTKARTVRNDGLYAGRSPSERARGRAAGRAVKDRSSQARRVARDGVGSSADARQRRAESRSNKGEPKAKTRESTKAREVRREGLYDQNSPANRARGNAAAKRNKDRQSQASRDVTSPEYAARKQRERQEADAKRKQAEQKAKDLQAKAKAAREQAEKLTGKEKRTAREEAEKLEAQAKVARQESQRGQSGEVSQDHLYERDRSPADEGRAKADARREAKFEPLYTSTPGSVVRESAVAAPVSSPPIITRSATAMQQASNRQAWQELETQLALIS